MSALPPVAHAPGWFRDALAVPFTDEQVIVEGATIHYLAWGEPGRRGLVFVHGGGAHAHWWTHVAARFAPAFRVVAIDLSGHGDSEHRDVYDLEQWTREVMAVADAGGIAGPPVVVGHSMGGFVTIATAALNAERLTGVVVCDSPVTEPDPEVESYRLKEAFGSPRTYASVDEAVARFRTVPPQEHYLDYVMDHVARRSLTPVDGGWQWKFDRHVFAQFAGGMRGIAMPYLSQVRCRFALLRSEHGLVTPDLGAAMYDTLGRVAPVIELPEAGHHAMLDVPLVLLTALRTLLADWDHSEPHRPAERRGRSVTLPAVTDFAARYGPWALVTGAAQGVGLAFTEALLARGCGVVLVDRLPEVADVAEGLSGDTIGVVADLAEPDWLDAVSGAAAGLEIGLAVANAAASYVGRFLDQSAASRATTVAVNCLATTDLAAWALPPMVARGRGGFVVTSSGSALAGTASVATYSASKAYVLNLAEAIGWELQGTGVDCQAVVAPAMDTPGWRSHPIDEARMFQPAVDPRTVVEAALDHLSDGGWYLADPGLAYVAGLERTERVELLSSTTSGLYPEEYGTS